VAGATDSDSVGDSAADADGLGASDAAGVAGGVGLGGGVLGVDGGGDPLAAGPTYAVVKFAQRYARVVSPDA
jgi:hypothetical protein